MQILNRKYHDKNCVANILFAVLRMEIDVVNFKNPKSIFHSFKLSLRVEPTQYLVLHVCTAKFKKIYDVYTFFMYE